MGLGLCFSGVVAVLGGAGFLFRCCFVVVVLWLFAMVIPNSSEWTRQHKSLWAPQSMKIYHYATELCISETENTNLVIGVFGFHHSHSKFLSLGDENKIRKSSQKKKKIVDPTFFDNSIMSCGSYHSKHL